MATKDINAIYAGAIDGIRKRFAKEVGDSPIGILNLSVSKASIKANDPKNPDDIVCVATTDFTDLDQEVIVPGGADLSYFTQNNAIFVDHNYDVESVVAKRRSMVPYPDVSAMRGWRVRCSLIKGSRYEQTIRSLAAEGVVGCSIGLQAVDYGQPTPEEKKTYPAARSIVRRWKWLELSFTSMPCNMECRVMLSGIGNVTTAKSKRVVVLL